MDEASTPLVVVADVVVEGAKYDWTGKLVVLMNKELLDSELVVDAVAELVVRAVVAAAVIAHDC